MKDYYYILGIDKGASKDAIKTSYRKLSIKFHPDHNNGDKFFEERFKEVNEAYNTLSDDVKRSTYDTSFYQKNSANKEQSNYSNNSQNDQAQPKRKPSKTNYQTSPKTEKAKGYGARIRNFALGLLAIIIILFVRQIIASNTKKDALNEYHQSQKNQNKNYKSYDTNTIAPPPLIAVPRDSLSNSAKQASSAITDTSLIVSPTSSSNTPYGYCTIDADSINKVYFHNTPKSSDIRNAYFAATAEVFVQKTENGFGYIEFTNSEGQLSYGWIDLNYLTLHGK
jgi:curved DNA-binding protein CbpA